MKTDSASKSSDDSRRDRAYKIMKETGALRRFAARKMFGLAEMIGFHVTADHFYEIVPNTRVISKDYDAKRRPCYGIEFNESDALAEWLRIVALCGRGLYESGKRYGYYENNAYFRGVDGLTLYAMVRNLRPSRVVEVGQGFSTRVILSALDDNADDLGSRSTFTSIDPYARFAPEADRVTFELCKQPLQQVSHRIIETLQTGDLLFVDSSHVFKFGSDVQLFFEQIYPRIPSGVVVHIHDIFTPYDYPLQWMAKGRRFWNEQYHLENFLRFNSDYKVILPLHLLMRESQEARNLSRSIIEGPDYLLTGQSIYLRRN